MIPAPKGQELRRGDVPFAFSCFAASMAICAGVGGCAQALLAEQFSVHMIQVQ